MKHRISHIAVHQASKLVAILYFGLGLLMVPFLWILGRMDPDAAPLPFLFLLLFPIGYAVVTYLVMAVMVALYNLAARRFGGIEMTLAPIDGTT